MVEILSGCECSKSMNGSLPQSASELEDKNCKVKEPVSQSGLEALSGLTVHAATNGGDRRLKEK